VQARQVAVVRGLRAAVVRLRRVGGDLDDEHGVRDRLRILEVGLRPSANHRPCPPPAAPL